MGSREGLLDDGQKLFTYIGLDILTEGWVKPCHFSIPILCSGGGIPGIGIKFQFMSVLTSLQGSFWWGGMAVMKTSSFDDILESLF